MLWACGAQKSLSANPIPLQGCYRAKRKLKTWNNKTKMKRSDLQGTTQLLSWSLIEQQTEHVPHIKPMLFPSSVLHEWLISTNTNGANCSKSILKHIITVGKYVKNYPLFQTHHFTLFYWKKSKIPGCYLQQEGLFSQAVTAGTLHALIQHRILFAWMCGS